MKVFGMENYAKTLSNDVVDKLYNDLNKRDGPISDALIKFMDITEEEYINTVTDAAIQVLPPLSSEEPSITRMDELDRMEELD